MGLEPTTYGLKVAHLLCRGVPADAGWATFVQVSGPSWSAGVSWSAVLCQVVSPSSVEVWVEVEAASLAIATAHGGHVGSRTWLGGAPELPPSQCRLLPFAGSGVNGSPSGWRWPAGRMPLSGWMIQLSRRVTQ